jgi:DNA-binding response OmpR family regulator
MAGEKILVVDDSKVNVKMLDEYLRNGYEVVKAYNGEEALRKVKDSPPDLILLDIIMPGIDGYEVCERLKADPRTSFIPIVMVTSLEKEEERIKGLELGAEDYIVKPFSPGELRARVQRVLSRPGMASLKSKPSLVLGDLVVDPSRKVDTEEEDYEGGER